jgi:hypothetical protein
MHLPWIPQAYALVIGIPRTSIMPNLTNKSH